MSAAMRALPLVAAAVCAGLSGSRPAVAQQGGTPPRPAASPVGTRGADEGTPGTWAASAARAVADRRLAEGLDAAAFTAVRTAVADAAARALPLEPLVARALAGVEAGAPGPRVVIAVRTLVGRLDAARLALAPATGDAEVVAGADALAVGVPPAVLRDLRRLSPGRSTAVPLGVVAQLVARGVPVARAAAAVSDLVRRGASGAQLVALDGAVRADVAAGMPAAAALDAQARRVASGPLLAPLSRAPGAGLGGGVVGATGELTNGGTAQNTGTRPTSAGAGTGPSRPPRRP
jgi:hypothetical protein